MKIKVFGGNLSDKCWSQQDYWAWPRGHPGLPSSLVFCKPGYFHTHRASIFEVPACVEPSVPGCLLGNWLTAPKSQTKTTGQPGSPNYLLVNTALIFPMMYLYLFLYLGNQIPQIHPPDRKLLFTSNPMIFSFSLVPRPWFGLTEDFHNIQNIPTCKFILILQKMDYHCRVLCATVHRQQTGDGNWLQPLSSPLMASPCSRSHFDGTLMALFSPPNICFAPFQPLPPSSLWLQLEMAFYRVIWRIL